MGNADDDVKKASDYVTDDIDEDGLYNARNAYEALVLVKDKKWSQRLEKYIAMLPELQQGLPVEQLMAMAAMLMFYNPSMLASGQEEAYRVNEKRIAAILEHIGL